MRVLFLAILATLPRAASAQQNPDSSENIVVTATRVPSPVANLPAGITVIDRKTIEERGYVSLVDALSAVPGLRVVQTGGPGSQTSVFIRGTNSNHVLVLRDGVPINDPGDPGGAYNFGIDTLNDVERIEIVRGPLSSLYGSGAIGGVINLITRHGAGAPHGHATLAAGVPRAGLAQGDVSGGFGIYDYAANVEGLSERGFDQTPSRERAVYTGEPDGDRSKTAQVELGATPFTDTRFSVLVRGRDAKYGYDTGLFSAFDGGNATGYDASLYGRLGATSKLFGGVWETTLYLTGLQNDRRYTVTLVPTDPNQLQEENRYHGRRADAQWNNTVHLPDTGLLRANTLIAGYEHVTDRADSKVDDAAFGSAFDIGRVKAHSDSDAGYVGGQTTFLDRLDLTGQIREDGTTLSGNAFTWRIGGVIDIAALSSRIKASYGTSFRAPALNDLYGFDSFGGGFGFVGNPRLRPERAGSFEAGLSSDLSFRATGDVNLSATYFRNRISGLIVQEPTPGGLVFSPVNIERALTQGIEATVTIKVAPWLQADLTYTYTDARNLETHAQLSRRPYNQGSANLRIVPVRDVVITPELLYTGAFQDFPTSDGGIPGFALASSPSGVIFNLNASWQATRAVQLFAWGKNLSNSHFEPVNGYQTPGASFLAGTRLAF